MKSNKLFIVLIVLLVAFGVYCMCNKNKDENYEMLDGEMSSSGVDNNEMSSNEMGSNYEDLTQHDLVAQDYNAPSSFGTGPAAAPGISPNWSML